MFSQRLRHAIRTAARHEIYKECVHEWFSRDPGQAQETVRFIREVTAQDLRDGKWENDDGAAVQLSVRFPSDLFFILRQALPGPPPWGDDDRDMRDFLREFPDLIPPAMQKRIGLHHGKSKRTTGRFERVSDFIARGNRTSEGNRKGKTT